MRVALLSDLHGNLVALEAVLADIQRRGTDQIVCLGDVATLGPRPCEVLALLQDLRCPCILGNHDAFLLDDGLIRGYTEAKVVVDAVDWCRDRIGPADLAFLQGFLPRLSLSLDGADVLLYHGTPESHMVDVLATTPPDELDRLLGGYSARVMAGGHTHIQMLRQHRGTLLLNPGSVGMPFREYVHGGPPTVLSHAEYALIEGHHDAIDVTLCQVPLRKAALYDEIAATDNPLREGLMAAYAP